MNDQQTGDDEVEEVYGSAKKRVKGTPVRSLRKNTKKN